MSRGFLVLLAVLSFVVLPLSACTGGGSAPPPPEAEEGRGSASGEDMRGARQRQAQEQSEQAGQGQ